MKLLCTHCTDKVSKSVICKRCTLVLLHMFKQITMLALSISVHTVCSPMHYVLVGGCGARGHAYLFSPLEALWSFLQYQKGVSNLYELS